MSRALTAQTRLAGVIGDPVRHSLSPVIHNAWLEAAGIDAAYLAFPVKPEGFAGLVRGLAGEAALGLNVTIPYKEAAAGIADQRSAAVERAAPPAFPRSAWSTARWTGPTPSRRAIRASPCTAGTRRPRRWTACPPSSTPPRWA